MSQLGERIKAIREKEELTQEELANKANLSLKQVSMLEECNVLPNLSILVRICRALDVKADILLDGTENENITITRKTERKEAAIFSAGSSQKEHPSNKFKMYSLAPTKSNRIMEPSVIELIKEEPNEYSSSHEGEEFFYIIRGEVRFDYGEHTYTLTGGDSVYFDSLVPHRFSSETDSSKIVIVTYTPL